MGEKEDREKAEKLAAAKKRVAQLQKKKKAAGGDGGEKSSKAKDKSSSKDEALKSPTKEDTEEQEPETKAEDGESKENLESAVEKQEAEGDDVDADEATFQSVINAAKSSSVDNEESDSPGVLSPISAENGAGATSKSKHSARQPSISLQSKIRSSSFRESGPISPATAGPSRVEELEKENKKLAKESEEHERRWRKVEEELEELREKSAEEIAKQTTSEGGDRELERLRSEIETLRRQNRSTSLGAGPKPTRRESGQGVGDDADSLRKDIESKDSTIADMQLEMSRLRSQLSNQTQGCETHGEQIEALQTSLSSTERKLRSIEVELTDTKKALTKASEKAMLDGTERTSKDTKIRSLERELDEAVQKRDEVVKKVEQLEKKVEAMTKLHREAEARNASKLSAAETMSREVPTLRAKIEKLEGENGRLREKHKRVMSGGGADDGLDELEDEERQKLEKRIRELEGQVFELQRGVWRDKRVQMQPRGDESRTSLEAAGEDFDEVDLSGSAGISRQRSLGSTISQQTQAQTRHSGFTQVLNSGLAAFRGTPDPHAPQQRPRNDSLLQEFDDDATFDENAFAQAQREEEARKMVEHVREVKRGLKNWNGWRLDLVDARRVGGGGVGVGEIFEV